MRSDRAGILVEGILANLFQKGVDFVFSPFCGGRQLIASCGRPEELSLGAGNYSTVLNVSVRERLADLEERVCGLVLGGSGHIVDVRDAREAEPEWC